VHKHFKRKWFTEAIYLHIMLNISKHYLRRKGNLLPTVWNEYLVWCGHDNFCSTFEYLHICSPKLGELWRLSPPPGYTPGNSDWWLGGFDPVVASANLVQTIQVGHKKTAWLAKFATDSKMRSLLARSFRLHHTIWAERRFSGDCGVGEDSSF